MRLVLRQSFPLGRFHANPWRVNPFDDPFGEWPPSPWRLVRAVVARWHQWTRETGIVATTDADDLVRALCDSAYSFCLPTIARRGSPIRQYHPVEFGWEPPGKTKGKGEEKRSVPQLRTYGTSLTQDNFWCVPPGNDGMVWWFVEGDRWTSPLVEILDRCLDRLVYFGRTESFTVIKRVDSSGPTPNCKLLDRPNSASSVKILTPAHTAVRADIERVTDDPRLASSVPPGAQFMYADLPRRPPAREEPLPFPTRVDCRFMQIAIGWNVPPEPRAVVRLTERFRSAVLSELLTAKTGKRGGNWSSAPVSVRSQYADMFGKDADGKPLTLHEHTEFFVWWEGRLPTRLVVWRKGRPFDHDEQAAILRAASRKLSWAAVGPTADAWKIRLIPLDIAVTLPPGLDGSPSSVWDSLTPYVPPRHNLRGGKPRESESVTLQVRRELSLRGVPGAESVEVEPIEEAAWVAVHVPRKMADRRASHGDRRGYRLRLKFAAPVTGPLRIGHSSSFGLGLFKPVPETS